MHGAPFAECLFIVSFFFLSSTSFLYPPSLAMMSIIYTQVYDTLFIARRAMIYFLCFF